jgi:hypothetical protein
VLFTFPSRYLFAIGRVGVLRLGKWSSHVQTGFLGSRPTQVHLNRFTHTGLSPTLARLSRRFWFRFKWHWPGPRSLATTCGVSVDVLSSGYLDVSVPQVRFLTLCIQIRIPLTRWVSPFGNPRIKVCSQLPGAYRSVLRPSSPLHTKASTKCPYRA